MFRLKVCCQISILCRKYISRFAWCTKVTNWTYVNLGIVVSSGKLSLENVIIQVNPVILCPGVYMVLFDQKIRFKGILYRFWCNFLLFHFPQRSHPLPNPRPLPFTVFYIFLWYWRAFQFRLLHSVNTRQLVLSSRILESIWLTYNFKQFFRSFFFAYIERVCLI